ncbi:MAG: hypothetical protein IPM03_06540 [Sulfuritalea sp.]|nr:hypothetical protein [Sulfuritalea sp.]
MKLRSAGHLHVRPVFMTKVEELFNDILLTTANYLPTIFNLIVHPRRVLTASVEREICSPGVTFFVSASLAYGTFLLDTKTNSVIGWLKHEHFIAFAICYIAVIANLQRKIFCLFAGRGASLPDYRVAIALLTYPYSVAAFVSAVAYLFLLPGSYSEEIITIVGAATSALYLFGLFQVGRIVFLLTEARSLAAALSSYVVLLIILGVVAFVLSMRA